MHLDAALNEVEKVTARKVWRLGGRIERDSEKERNEVKGKSKETRTGRNKKATAGVEKWSLGGFW